MAKIKFAVEPEAFDQTGFAEPAKPGTYIHQVKEINAGYSKGDDGQEDKTRPRLEVIWENVDPKAAKMGVEGGSAVGSRVWDYVTFGKGSQWKLAQFTRAFGLADKGKPSGEFDTAKLAEKVTDIDKTGKKVTKETKHPGAKAKLRLTAGSDQDGNYRSKVGSILPLGGDDGDVESDGFGEEEVVDDEVAEETTGYTEADLKAMLVPALKEVATALSVEFKGLKKSEVVAAILAAQEAAAEEDDDMIEDDDEEIIEEEEASGYSEDDLKAMETPDLKEVARNLGVSFGGKKKSEVIAAIIEAQASSGGEAVTDDSGDDELPF